jgi:predicted nuclease of predicted toxin-antitoxin system
VTFFFDQHMPHVFARILRDRGIDAIHLRERFQRDADDVEWLPVAGRHGWIVITADHKTRSRKEELLALRRERVIVFFFAKEFNNKTIETRTNWFLGQWQQIEQQATIAQPGDCFLVPRKGKIRPYPLPPECD